MQLGVHTAFSSTDQATTPAAMLPFSVGRETMAVSVVVFLNCSAASPAIIRTSALFTPTLHRL